MMVWLSFGNIVDCRPLFHDRGIVLSTQSKQYHAAGTPRARGAIAARIAVAAAWAALAASLASLAGPAAARDVDVSTLKGKVLVGYQTWFRCPGDGSPFNNWSHWTVNDAAPTGDTITVDNFADVGEYAAASRCPTAGLTINGQPAALFSSMPLETSMTHFRWMRDYDIDGALIQRFIGAVDRDRQENDQPVRNARTAAEAYGRTFAIEYDMSGNYDPYTDDQVMAIVRADWAHLVTDLQLTASAAYLRPDGRPLVSLWGLGFDDSGHLNRPALAQKIVAFFRDEQHATVMGGVPWFWDTIKTSSAHSGVEWPDVFAMLDVIQPWTVGAYGSVGDVDGFKVNHYVPDVAQVKANGHGQLYMPVLFPGGSNYNQTLHGGTDPQNATLNSVRREGGQFLWRQAADTRGAGADLVKIAMFDEVNEGTALFKTAATRADAPAEGAWLTNDADGIKLPNDWYLRLGYEIGRMYRGESAVGDMPALPGSVCGALVGGNALVPNQSLASCNGLYALVLQGDGNLVAYHGQQAIWASSTAGQAVAQAAFGVDGNLALLDAAGRVVWNSSSGNGNVDGDPARLQMGDDGNVTIVRAGVVVAQTGTAGR